MTDDQLNVTLFDKFVKKHSLKKGDTVKVLRKTEEGEFGWPLSFLESMESLIGQEVTVQDTYRLYGVSVRSNDGRTCYYVPVFILEFIKSAPVLPVIELNENYSAEVDEKGNIQVGCQNITFEKLEEVYLVAKQQRG